MANFTPTGVTFVAQGLSKYIGNLGKADKAQQRLGKGIALFATALAGAALDGFKAVTQEGQAFTKEMSTVSALTGAVGKDFKSLEGIAKKLGATTKFTATEAAEGLSFLARAGFETDEAMLALPGTLDLAAAANIELGQSADIVSNILTGFGATASDTGQFVDVLTKTFTTSNTNLVQLGQAMKFVGPIASSLGISVEDTAAAIGKLGDAGIQGSLAGTSLRGALLALTSPSNKAKDVMEEYGIEIFNAKGEMLSLPAIIGNVNRSISGLSQEQQVVALKTLVGTKRLAAFQVLLREGEASLRSYGGVLRDSVGTASEIASVQMDNLAGDTLLLNSAFSSLKIEVFEALEPSLRKSAQVMTELVTEMAKAADTWSFVISTTIELDKATQDVTQTFDEFGNTQREITVGSNKMADAEKKAAQNAKLLAKAEKEVNEATRLAAQSASTFTIEIMEEAKALEGLSEKLLIAADKGTFFLSAQERIQVILARNTAGIEAQAARMAGLAASFGAEADFTRITPEQAIAAQKVEVDIDTGDIGRDIGNSISDGLENIKSAISQVSGLTFDEILPPQETFRVDEWARRMASVAQDGKSQWVDAIVTQFGGQEFLRPLEDAIAAGDTAGISTAAQDILDGPALFELMDIEGAVTEVEGLIAEQNLQQRINDAILAAITGAGLEMPTGEGIGGGLLLNAIGLGEGSNPGEAITTAVTGLGIPGLINQAMLASGSEEGEANPLLTLLGLGEDGIFAAAIAVLIGETIPSIGLAFTALFENTKLGFDDMLLATQTWDMSLVNMATTTIINLQNAIVTMITTGITNFKNFDKQLATTDKNLKKLRDTIGKEIVEALQDAIKETEKWIAALERALAVRNKLRPSGGGPGAGAGIGFQAGTGPFGFLVPPGFPNDSFPINVESGERVLVAPRGRSIEDITGTGGRQQIINVSATINNGMDEMILVEKIRRVTAEGFDA